MNELERLEREVEQARARVASDLTRLRAPGAFSELKRELTSEVRTTKEEILEKTKEAATDGMQSVLAEIKARVAANPAAALAVGAGLAWRLTRHPPVASVLLGYGLVSLFRTDPQQPRLGADVVDRVSDLADTAKARLEGWQESRAAGGAGDGTAGMGEIAEAAKERMADWSSEAGATMRDVAEQTRNVAQSLTESGRHAVNRAMNAEHRDKYLLGAAALALAAAMGVAYQRRAGSNSHGE